MGFRKRCRAVALFFVTIVYSGILVGQTILGKPELDYSSKSPDILSMQKMVNTPVNNFTGAIAFSIPLYTVSSKSITVPIRLEYNGGGGIKMDDYPGIFGVGWSLEAGGMITRQIRGLEDEGGAFQDGPLKLWRPIHYSPYWEPDTLWISERDSVAQTLYNTYGSWTGLTHSQLSGLKNEITYHNQNIDEDFPWYNNREASLLSYGLLDSEPDLFYFKFGGYSGKFIFNAVGEAIITPYTQDLKIERVITSRRDSIEASSPFPTPHGAEYNYYTQKCLESFKVTTPEGLIYYFGLNEDDRAYPGMEINSVRKIYNGWALSQIVNKVHNDTITFVNTRKGEVSVVPNNRQLFVMPDNEGDCINKEVFQAGSENNNMPRLAAIKTSKEEVLFSVELGSLLEVKNFLTKEVYRRISKVMQRGISGKDRLLFITDKDMVTDNIETYRFSYYDTPAYKGYYAQDAWGFYNGATNIEGLMPSYAGCPKVVNRSPSWPEMQLDILTAVTYPTGGKVFFEYEPHRVYSGTTPHNGTMEGDGYIVSGMPGYSLLNIVGGVRIKALKTYDPVTQDTLYKRYSYNRFGTAQSSGHLYMAPYLYANMSDFDCSVSGNPIALISRNNMFKGDGTGLHVGYQQVTVQESIGLENNGYVQYEYYDNFNTDSSFFSNAMAGSINTSINDTLNVYPSWQHKLLPENYLRGKEKEVKIYNSQNTLQEKEQFIYESKIDSGYNNYVRGAIINVLHSQQICRRNYSTGSYPIMRNAYFFYYDTIQKQWVRDMTLTNHTVERPAMKPFGSFYFMYHYTIAKNKITLKQHIKESRSSNGVTSIDTTEYLYGGQHVNPTNVISKNSKGEINQFQTFYAFDFNDVSLGDSTIYFMKKSFYNPPLATFNYKNNLIYAGGYRRYKLFNSVDTSILLFEDYALLSSNAGVSPLSLNISLTYPQVFNYPSSFFNKNGTYNYRTDKTLSHILTNGNDKVVTLWDYNNQHVVAQVRGSDSTDVAYTSFETTYRGNWNMSSTVVDTVYALTGKRSYNLLNGSITKTGLNTAKNYIVSYWSRSEAANVGTTMPVSGEVKNGWRYYEHRLPSNVTMVSITGSVVIDELRLYPTDSYMETYTFGTPFGVTSIGNLNNDLLFYEYNGKGQVLGIRDVAKNILKKGEQFITGTDNDVPLWVLVSGIPRQKKCPSDTTYLSRMFEVEQKDINPNSPSFNMTAWVDVPTYPCNDCSPADWQNTVKALRCQQGGSGQNTGVQEQEQKDMNPCSPTYNQTRWVVSGLNYGVCPLPCVGPDKMMVGGVCVTGTKRYIATAWDASVGMFKCIYKYTFPPNCTTGPEYFEYGANPCMPSPSCVMD